MSSRLVLTIFIASLNAGACVPLASKSTEYSLGSGLAGSDKQVTDLSSENGNVGAQLRLQHGATASEDDKHTTLSNVKQVASPKDPGSPSSLAPAHLSALRANPTTLHPAARPALALAPLSHAAPCSPFRTRRRLHRL